MKKIASFILFLLALQVGFALTADRAQADDPQIPIQMPPPFDDDGPGGD